MTDAAPDFSELDSALGKAAAPAAPSAKPVDDFGELDAALSVPKAVAPAKVEPHQAKRWNPPASKPSAPTARAPQPMGAADIAADIGKTAASQGALGATADIVGLPASVNQLWQKGSGALESLTARAKEATGLAPRGSAEQAIALAKQQATSEMSASDKAGDTSNIFGWEAPTSQSVEKGLVKGFPALGYAPKTQAAKIIGAGARAVPTALVAGPEGLIGRAAMGAGAGIASELAGEATEGTPYEPYARLLAGVVGAPVAGKLAKSVGAITPIAQEAGATKALTRALAADQASGSAPMTLKQAAAAPGAGAWNAAGANTKALVHRLAKHPDSQDAVMRLNQLAGEQKAAAATNIGNHISDTLGLDQAPFDLKAAIKQGSEANVNHLYDTMGSSPQAQAVTSPLLNKLSQSDTIKALGKKAASVASDPDSRVVPPTEGGKSDAYVWRSSDADYPISPTGDPVQHGGKSYTPVINKLDGKSTFVPTEQIIQTASKSGTPGNLFYWDQIKQGLDDGYNVAQRQGEMGEARRLLGLKKQLVSELDTQVPGYADARGAAAESFGAQNAVEAGYNAVSKKLNDFSAGQTTQAFGKLNDQQKAMFAQGAGGYLKEVGLNAGPDPVIKAMTDIHKAPILRGALGEDNYNSILGRAYNESFMKNARTLSISSGEAPGTMDQVLNAEALLQTPHAIGHLVLSGNPLPLGGLLASKAAEGLLDSYKSAVDKAQAKTVFGLLGTQDPKKLAQLGKMVSSSPKAKGFFYSLGNALRAATVRAVVSNQPKQSETNPQGDQDVSKPDTDSVFSRMLHQESGARQFDKTGKVITSPKGAVGISQIMPSTGPEAAKLAGEEWDPERLANDPAYNQKLGAAYHKHLTEQLGDPVLGAAAYNGGLSRVQSALEKSGKTGESWLKYVPEETRNYVEAIMSQSPGRATFASGGSVDSEVDRLVTRLMNMAKQAKKTEDKSTETILKAPDNVVVKALAVAQRAI